MTFISPNRPPSPAMRQALTNPRGAANTRNLGAAPALSRSTVDDRRQPNPILGVAPTPPTDGGGGGGGGGNFDFGPLNMGPVVETPAMTDEQYLSADTMFQSQKNALQAALAAYIADLDAQRQTFETNYGESLRKLGFTGDRGAIDKAKWDPQDARYEVDDKPLEGTWSETDRLTASGRGYENLLNDFAARGTLQSSAYARARNDLMRQLNEQLGSTVGARQTAMGEFTRGRAAKEQETKLAESQAAQEALARIKAAYGIGQELIWLLNMMT